MDFVPTIVQNPYSPSADAPGTKTPSLLPTTTLSDFNFSPSPQLMAKTLRILALTLLACFCLQAQDANSSATIPAGAKSPARLDKVRQLLEAQAQIQGTQATTESLQKAITDAFLASDPALKG